MVVPRDAGISQQLVDPRSVYKHYSPYDLVSLAQEVCMYMYVFIIDRWMATIELATSLYIRYNMLTILYKQPLLENYKLLLTK